MDDRDLLRYSRHILLDEIGIEGQEKLLAARVLVVGCGGLGNAALPYLAAAGVGTLVFADPDRIEAHNLQRQTAFTEADIGQNKALALAGYLRQANSRCRLITLPERLEGSRLAEEAEKADVVLDCSDQPATRQAVNRACVATGTPLVSGAAERFEGQLAVFRPDLPDAPCYACLFGSETAAAASCALLGVFAPLVGIIGATQAAEALKLLLGRDSGHSILRQYDALDGQWRPFAFRRRADCPVCGQNKAV